MKIISSKIHGFLDYPMGILLIVSPWLFGFQHSAALWPPLVIGVVMVIMSIYTNYELGIIKVISMKTHLTMDIIAGLFLAASPWIIGFSETVYLPHLVLGLVEAGTALMTDSKVSHMKKPATPKLTPSH